MTVCDVGVEYGVRYDYLNNDIFFGISRMVNWRAIARQRTCGQHKECCHAYGDVPHRYSPCGVGTYGSLHTVIASPLSWAWVAWVALVCRKATVGRNL